MTAQLLFYDRVTPISTRSHGDVSIESGTHYGFARGVNSVPLTAVEIPRASREYSIVFAGQEEVVPVVILGIEGNANLYVTEDGKWDAQYVPAFVRRYPFVFSRSEDGGTFTLCLDESFEGLNREGRGQRLFDDGGERTPYLENVLGFLQEYQNHFLRTRAYCAKLKELDLLEPMQAQFRLADGAQRSLTGFQAVSRERLKALPAEKLAELAKTDELELTHVHLNSMNNFSLMLERVAAGRTVASTPDDPAAITTEAEGADAAPKEAAPAKKKRRTTH
ncbi:MAG TPA: SapC family protein [Pseudomonadales bacterium]|nr:SapC family protein [Pseudomonadales bacterium]